MELPQARVTGTLQTKIMILLRDRPLCGTELMEELGLKSAGTIYPALHVLESKGLIAHDIERTGAARKKVYRLTGKGEEDLEATLNTWTRLTCCDWSFYIKRFIDVVNDVTGIKEGEKVLCTLDADLTKEWLKGADVAYSFDLENMDAGHYDKIISLIGVGTVMRRVETDAAYYLSRLKEALKEDGTLVALEIEKTDNLWAERYFVCGYEKLPKAIWVEALQEPNLISAVIRPERNEV